LQIERLQIEDLDGRVERVVDVPQLCNVQSEM